MHLQILWLFIHSFIHSFQIECWEDFFKVLPIATKGRTPHQRPCWSRLPPWANVDKPINSAIVVTLIIHNQNQLAIQGSTSYLQEQDRPNLRLWALGRPYPKLLLSVSMCSSSQCIYVPVYVALASVASIPDSHSNQIVYLLSIITSLTWLIIPGPLPLFRTASDGKLGGAWKRGYLGEALHVDLIKYSFQIYMWVE